MDIVTLFETNDILVINKPPGILVHPDGKKNTQTITDWILDTYPMIAGVGEPAVVQGMNIDRPGIVHRLDEETSGVLIIAKTQNAFQYLKQQFQSHQIEKEYHAFVWGHFKEEEGEVNQPIGRSRGDFRKWLSGRGIRGESREAFTKWKVLTQFFDENKNPFSFLALFPKTGRTHQLRVHMKYLQRPIVSDPLYASSKLQALGFRRVALHARTIRFFDANGVKIEVSAPYPKDFEAAIAKYIKS